MKNRIITIAFLLLNLVSVGVFADQDSIDQSATVSSTGELADNPVGNLVNNTDAKSDKTGNRIIIDFDGDDAGEADGENENRRSNEDLSEALDVLAEVFGGEIGDKISTKVEHLDDDELARLGTLFAGTNIRFGDGSGLGFGEFMIAITAITFSLGLPVIVLLLVFIFGHRKRKQKMELISNYLQADQPVPEHVMADFGSSSSGNTIFHSGLKFALVGIAISLALWIMGDSEAAAIGLIPMAIGAAKLIAWKFDDAQIKL